jgi:phosphomannomutase
VIGDLHDGLDPILAGRFAAGLGMVLREELGAPGPYPTVAVASDGRAVTQGHFAQIVERLRWAGCDVADLGSVPCPALLWAIGENQADGGVYLGNPEGTPHRAGVRFYGRDGRPVTGSGALSAVCAWVEDEPDRPVRTSGKAGQSDVLRLYGSRFTDFFHGLRPLRFLLHTTCRPAGATVERLLRQTACKMVLRVSESLMPAEPLPESVGHFGATIEDDGQQLRLWDERGRIVPFESLFSMIVGSVYGNEPFGRIVVFAEGSHELLTGPCEKRGLAVERCGPLPSDIHAAMVRSGAALGADRVGRIWYGEAGERAIADALGTLTLILGKLSEGDRPLSEVLDGDGTAH